MKRGEATSAEWTVEHRDVRGVDTYRVLRDGAEAPWSELAAALVASADARAALIEALRAIPHEAFFWECRPWRDGDPIFELVPVPTSAFARQRASPRAFAEHFDGGLVAASDSLGGDARLVAPSPLGEPDDALHLARFVRRAPPAQVDAPWVVVGRDIDARRRAGRGPLWLSTSGLGVPWLHVRLDARPRHYPHAPYR